MPHPILLPESTIAQLKQQRIAVLEAYEEEDGQQLVAIQDEQAGECIVVPLAELTKTPRVFFNTSGVFRSESPSTAESVCESATKEGLPLTIPQKKGGVEWFAFAVEEQSDALKKLIQESPEEVAYTVNQLKKALTPEEYQSAKQDYATLVQEMGGSSSGSKIPEALAVMAGQLKDPELKRITVAAVVGTTPPPTAPVTIIIASESSAPAKAESPSPKLIVTSSVSERRDSPPYWIGGLSITRDELPLVYSQATSPDISDQKFFETLLAPNGGDLFPENFLSALYPNSPGVPKEILGAVRSGLSDLLGKIQKQPASRDTSGEAPTVPDAFAYSFKFRYHSNTSKLEILARPEFQEEGRDVEPLIAVEEKDLPLPRRGQAGFEGLPFGFRPAGKGDREEHTDEPYLVFVPVPGFIPQRGIVERGSTIIAATNNGRSGEAARPVHHEGNPTNRDGRDGDGGSREGRGQSDTDDEQHHSPEEDPYADPADPEEEPSEAVA